MLQRKAERKTGKGLVPYVSLKRYRLNKGFSEIIPDEISNTHRLIPLDLIGDILTIGAVRMPDEKIIERLKAHTGFRVQIMLITASDFDQYAQRAYNLSIVCGDKWIGDTKLGRYIKMPSYRGRERRRFRRFDKRIKIK